MSDDTLLPRRTYLWDVYGWPCWNPPACYHRSPLVRVVVACGMEHADVHNRSIPWLHRHIHSAFNFVIKRRTIHRAKRYCIAMCVGDSVVQTVPFPVGPRDDTEATVPITAVGACGCCGLCQIRHHCKHWRTLVIRFNPIPAPPILMPVQPSSPPWFGDDITIHTHDEMSTNVGDVTAADSME